MKHCVHWLKSICTGMRTNTIFYLASWGCIFDWSFQIHEWSQNTRLLHHVQSIQSHEATYTTTPPTVIPDEHHLHREEGLVSLPGMGEYHPALLLNDCCHLLWHCGVHPALLLNDCCHLLWHCGVVHCQCGSIPSCLCSRGERHSLEYHTFMCAWAVPSSSVSSVSSAK